MVWQGQVRRANLSIPPKIAGIALPLQELGLGRHVISCECHSSENVSCRTSSFFDITSDDIFVSVPPLAVRAAESRTSRLAKIHANRAANEPIRVWNFGDVDVDIGLDGRSHVVHRRARLVLDARRLGPGQHVVALHRVQSAMANRSGDWLGVAMERRIVVVDEAMVGWSSILAHDARIEAMAAEGEVEIVWARNNSRAYTPLCAMSISSVVAKAIPDDIDIRHVKNKSCAACLFSKSTNQLWRPSVHGYPASGWCYSGCEQSYVGRLARAGFAWGPTGVVFNDRVFVSRMQYALDRGVESDFYAVHRAPHDIGAYDVRAVECLAVVTMIYASHYGHFVYETLPRLLQLVSAMSAQGECKIMLEHSYTSTRPVYAAAICSALQFLGLINNTTCAAKIVEPQFNVWWHAHRMFFTNPLRGLQRESLIAARAEVHRRVNRQCSGIGMAATAPTRYSALARAGLH